MAWRDPFVIADPGRPGSWVMAICARTASGPLEASGCIGLATSDDLERWTVGPPLLTPSMTSELECPVIQRVGDEWLLLACVSERRCVDAWRADALLGPWEYLGPVGPRGAYAPRMAPTPDGLAVLHTQSQRFGRTDDAPMVRGCLSQPKLLRFSGTGHPYLGWWPAMDSRLQATGDDRVINGMALFSFEDPSVLVMQLGRTEKALRVTVAGRSISLGYADGTVLHTDTLTEPPRRTARILRYREFVEVYVDERFSLTHVAYGPPEPEAAGWADGKPLDAACADLRIPAH